MAGHASEVGQQGDQELKLFVFCFSFISFIHFPLGLSAHDFLSLLWAFCLLLSLDPALTCVLGDPITGGELQVQVSKHSKHIEYIPNTKTELGWGLGHMWPHGHCFIIILLRNVWKFGLIWFDWNMPRNRPSLYCFDLFFYFPAVFFILGSHLNACWDQTY